MPRTGAILIGACIVIIAASLGMILYVKAGFSLAEAGFVALCIALIMLLLRGAMAASRERQRIDAEIAHVHAVNNYLTQELGELRKGMGDLTNMRTHLQEISQAIEQRVIDSVEGRIATQVGEAKTTLVAEMQLIETLVRQMAENMTARQMSLEQAEESTLNASGAEAEQEEPQFDTPLGHLEDAQVLKMVRRSIENNRVDIYFQPVVTLPQRKVRYYEALTRLRADEGDLIMPADYLRVAEPAGIMPLIDNLLLFRTVQVVRRLLERNRSVGIFCNISMHSLVDPDFFPQFMEFLEHNKVLSESIIFEFGQSTINGSGPLEVESLAALKEQGFRFSMDKVTNLDVDARSLSDLGFKFLRVDANLLLDGSSSSGAQIHPADLARLVARDGIELIAEKIENETTLVNLLDYDIGLAQGYLFAEPKPVRGDFGEELEQDRPLRKTG